MWVERFDVTIIEYVSQEISKETKFMKKSNLFIFVAC